MRNSLMLLALLLLGASYVTAQDWAGRGRLQGVVTSPDGKPIKEAQVTLYLDEEGRGPEPRITDKRGRWSVLGLATGEWTVVIEAEGYKISEGQIRVISEAIGPGQTIKTTLNPIPKELIEAAEGPDLRGMIDRGNILLTQGKHAEARAEYEKALSELKAMEGGEENIEARVALLRAIANAHYGEGSAEMAISTLKKALDLAMEDQESLKLLVTLLAAEGRMEEAAPYQARITVEFKLDPNILLNQGIDDYNAGKMEEAAAKFDQVVAKNPDLPDAYFYRGLVNLSQGNNDAAKADFEKLLALAPDHPKAAEAKEFLSYL